MIRINLKDKNFVNQAYSSMHGSSKSFEWDRSCTQPGPVVYTDAFLNDTIAFFAGEKIAWVVEPAVIYPELYTWIRSNWKLFREVWTHDEELINSVPNACWVPVAGTWICKQDRKMHDKNKLCSFIASSKNYAPGHKLRQEIRKALPSTVDQFGAGYRPVRNKAEGLSSYCFSIAVENCDRDTYFTEKIIDCFLTGTIPVYWGTWKISKHFDAEGILHFKTIDELLAITGTLSFGKYESMKRHAAANYALARGFETGEERIINYLNRAI